MNRRNMLRSVIGAGSLPLFGTQNQTDMQREFTIRSEVRLVLLDVAVRDSKGLAKHGSRLRAVTRTSYFHDAGE
jgi:hypothetical protein